MGGTSIISEKGIFLLCALLFLVTTVYGQTPGWSNDSALTVNGSQTNPAIASDYLGNSHITNTTI